MQFSLLVLRNLDILEACVRLVIQRVAGRNVGVEFVVEKFIFIYSDFQRALHVRRALFYVLICSFENKLLDLRIFY